jgi:hypothetical protein
VCAVGVHEIGHGNLAVPAARRKFDVNCTSRADAAILKLQSFSSLQFLKRPVNKGTFDERELMTTDKVDLERTARQHER